MAKAKRRSSEGRKVKMREMLCPTGAEKKSLRTRPKLGWTHPDKSRPLAKITYQPPALLSGVLRLLAD